MQWLERVLGTRAPELPALILSLLLLQGIHFAINWSAGYQGEQYLSLIYLHDWIHPE